MAEEYHQAWWGTWWPWAEANQGLLSILALIATLALAFREWKRADDAERRERLRSEREARERIQEFFAAADAIVAEFRRLIQQGRDELALRPGQYSDVPGVWLHASRGGSEALRLLAASAGMRPAAVMAAVNMARAMAGIDAWRWGPSTGDFWNTQIEVIELALERAIAKLDEQRA